MHLPIAASFASAFKELSANKLRTGLSLLGVCIGIFCIVAVTSVVDSLKKTISDSLSELGNDVLYVGKYAWIPDPGEKQYPWWKYKARPMCTLAELKQIKATVPSVGYAALMHSTNSMVQSSICEPFSAQVIASTYDFSQVQRFDLAQGRYFTLSEMSGSSNTVLLGATLKQTLFGANNCIGLQVKLFDRQFRVIGVLDKKGKSMTGFDFDNTAIVSFNYLNSFQKIDNPTAEWADNNLLIKPKPRYNFTEMCSEVKGALRAIRKVPPHEKDNFSFNLLSMVQSSIDSIFSTVNKAGLFIGIFSLLVGAFGIANIMFVTVKERTSQIGLKKAIGAKKSVIMIEFLIESVILCILGGLMGIGLVYVLVAFAGKAMDFPIGMSLGNFIFGISISTVVGIIAGFIPALRAASLNPVTAIRS
jgi:putative ABC transport system permease protein